MFPVGLLNSIHRALEPHNDKGKDFHFWWKKSCWWHKLDGQFRSDKLSDVYQNPSTKYLSPKFVANIDIRFQNEKILLKKSFILEVHKENRAYRETNFTWADFWYKLIISADNKHRKSITKISSTKLCNRNPVWELKSDWELFTVNECIWLLFSYRTHWGFKKSHFVSEVHQSKKVMHKLWSIIRKTVVSCDCCIISNNSWQWIF